MTREDGQNLDETESDRKLSKKELNKLERQQKKLEKKVEVQLIFDFLLYKMLFRH